VLTDALRREGEREKRETANHRGATDDMQKTRSMGLRSIRNDREEARGDERAERRGDKARYMRGRRRGAGGKKREAMEQNQTRRETRANVSKVSSESGDVPGGRRKARSEGDKRHQVSEG
jgi:hypothetical protein